MKRDEKEISRKEVSIERNEKRKRCQVTETSRDCFCNAPAVD